jgi:hypothetical protein
VRAAVESAVGEREEAEVAEPDGAARAPGNAGHLGADGGRDRLDAGMEAGHKRRGDGKSYETHSVGAGRFELPASASQTQCSTRLSYAPMREYERSAWQFAHTSSHLAISSLTFRELPLRSSVLTSATLCVPGRWSHAITAKWK